jgi:hypothetical protein
MNKGEQALRDMKDTIVGMAAGGASVAGWQPGQAALLGVKAEEAATARIATGQDIQAALDASISEAEMIVIMDMFCKAMDRTGDAQMAFDQLVAMKQKATEGVPGAEKAIQNARQAFHDALLGGLAPQSAMLSAFMSAAATMRLMEASVQ